MAFVESISSVYTYETSRKTWKNQGNYSVYIISYQLSGHYDHKFSSEVLSVKKDCLFFIPRGSVYSVSCKEQGKSACMTFIGELDLPPSVFDCSANPEIKSLFLKALNFRNLHSEANCCEVMSVLYSLIAFMYKSAKREYVAHGMRSKIEAAHTYMTENYTDPTLKTTELAARYDMSAKYFRLVFKKLYNTTPSQYLISLRLQTAVNFLNDTELGIGEISELSGFSDVYYFSKLFKARFSVSPKEFRKRQTLPELKYPTDD